jgi:hypothetical protein
MESAREDFIPCITTFLLLAKDREVVEVALRAIPMESF